MHERFFTVDRIDRETLFERIGKILAEGNFGKVVVGKGHYTVVSLGNGAFHLVGNLSAKFVAKVVDMRKRHHHKHLVLLSVHADTARPKRLHIGKTFMKFVNDFLRQFVVIPCKIRLRHCPLRRICKFFRA